MEGYLRVLQPDLTWYIGGILFLLVLYFSARIILRVLGFDVPQPFWQLMRKLGLGMVVIMTMVVGYNGVMRVGSNAVPRADVTGGSAVFDMQRR